VAEMLGLPVITAFPKLTTEGLGCCDRYTKLEGVTQHALIPLSLRCTGAGEALLYAFPQISGEQSGQNKLPQAAMMS